MLGFPVGEWLDTVEEALQEVSAPFLQSSQMAYHYAREKYPHLSVLGTAALCVVIGFGVYRSHKRNAKEKEARKEGKVNAIRSGFESLSALSLKQAELFEQHVELVANIRQKLDSAADDVPLVVLYSAKPVQTPIANTQMDRPPKRPPNRVFPKRPG